MAAATPSRPAPAVVTRPGSIALTTPDDDVLPGARILFAKLYGHPDGFSQIITRHLADLLSAWQEPPSWWFVPYRDPDPHLRIRLLLADGEYGVAVARVAEWAARLRRLGLAGDLVLDTYHPEIARYGAGDAMAAAELLFAADSAAAVAQLVTLEVARQVEPLALTAASVTDLAAAILGSEAAGMRWLIDHPEPATAAPPGRAMVRQTLTLAAPDRTAIRGLPGGEQLLGAWQRRRTAAAAYAAQLSDARRPSPGQVLVALLHLHHVRVHGINTGTENTGYRLARAVALAWRACHQVHHGPSTARKAGA
jgi:lantibiotic biosynthesis protein